MAVVCAEYRVSWDIALEALRSAARARQVGGRRSALAQQHMANWAIRRVFRMRRRLSGERLQSGHSYMTHEWGAGYAS